MLPDGKQYIGIAANKITQTPDLTHPYIYNWSKIQGEDGEPGQNGTSLVDYKIFYKLSRSSNRPDNIRKITEDGKRVITESDTVIDDLVDSEGNEIVDSNGNVISGYIHYVSRIIEGNFAWSTEIPELIPGYYLWTKTVSTYSNGEEYIAYSVAASGRGVASTKTEYYQSDSAIEPTGGEWSEEIPSFDEDKTYFSRVETTYTDGTVTVSTPKQDKHLNVTVETKAMAERTDKHFFANADGVHVTVGENTPDHGQNVRITNTALEIREDTTTMAQFGAELARVGLPESSHVDIQPSKTEFYGMSGQSAGKIANSTIYYQRNGEEIFFDGGDRSDMIAYSNTTATHTLTYRPVKNPNVSDPMLRIQVLLENGATGTTPINESVNFSAGGTASFATFPASVTYTSSPRLISVTFGNLSTVIPASWTEGAGITIRAYYYYAEYVSSYTFGVNSSTPGKYAYAGGHSTIAEGNWSHAHGRGLHTNKPDITVVGRYNKYANDYEDDVLFAIGNGNSDSSRSDAFQVLTDGYVWTERGHLPTYEEVFKAGNPINSNTSLYNVTSPGYYYVSTAAIANSLSGSPPFTGQPFNMLVLTSTNNIVMQIAWSNTPADRIKYRIKNASGSWNGVWHIVADPDDIRDYIYNLSNSFGDYDGLSVWTLAEGQSLNSISTTPGIHVAASYAIGNSLTNGPNGYKAGRYEVKRSLSKTATYYITELTPCTFPVNPKRARYYYQSSNQYGSWHAVSGGEGSFTVNSTNFSVTRSLICRNGNIVSVQLVLAAAKALAAGTAVTVGTLSPRPGLQVGVWAKSGTSQMQNAYLYSQDSNNLIINPTVALASGAAVEMNFTYGSEY